MNLTDASLSAVELRARNIERQKASFLFRRGPTFLYLCGGTLAYQNIKDRVLLLNMLLQSQGTFITFTNEVPVVWIIFVAIGFEFCIKLLMLVCLK